MSDLKSDNCFILSENLQQIENSNEESVNLGKSTIKKNKPSANSASTSSNCDDEITEYNSCQLILSQNDLLDTNLKTSLNNNNIIKDDDDELIYESVDILNNSQTILDNNTLNNNNHENIRKKNSSDPEILKINKQSFNQQQQISSSHIKIQLSRQSSTFSSKSRFSNRSFIKKETNNNSNNGGISLNNKRIVNFQQTNLSPINTNLDSSSVGSSNASIYSLNRDNNNNNNINNSNNVNLNVNETNNVMSDEVYCEPGVKEPILIRGAGNITIFGVCNKFNDQFPSQLTAKLAPEEFRDTINQINNILVKELANSFKWLVFGSLFCCCTLGCSLLPVIFMNKKAKLAINKLLDFENQRLYLKLGLKWRLAKMKCNSSSLFEYVLLVEFLPTLLLYQPD